MSASGLDAPKRAGGDSAAQPGYGTLGAMHLRTTGMDPWLLAQLACPRCRAAVRVAPGGQSLACRAGHTYPVADGDVPVMLLSEARQTHWVASYALDHFREPDPFAEGSAGGVDLGVQETIGATCGNLYGHLKGKLGRYPIPNLDLDAPPGTAFLDVGCHWGRWCISAARKGWRVVGLDPSLTGIRAAKRVAASLGVDASFVIGDGRFLPFSGCSFQIVHSYSVLQHFSHEDVRASLDEIARVLGPRGRAHIQMAQLAGLRNLTQQVRRGFRRPRAFEVR